MIVVVPPVSSSNCDHYSKLVTYHGPRGKVCSPFQHCMTRRKTGVFISPCLFFPDLCNVQLERRNWNTTGTYFGKAAPRVNMLPAGTMYSVIVFPANVTLSSAVLAPCCVIPFAKKTSLRVSLQRDPSLHPSPVCHSTRLTTRAHFAR